MKRLGKKKKMNTFRQTQTVERFDYHTGKETTISLDEAVSEFMSHQTVYPDCEQPLMKAVFVQAIKHVGYYEFWPIGYQNPLINA